MQPEFDDGGEGPSTSFQDQPQADLEENRLNSRSPSPSSDKGASSDSDYIVVSSDSEASVSDVDDVEYVDDDVEDDPEKKKKKKSLKQKKKKKKQRDSKSQKLPDDNENSVFLDRVNSLPSGSDQNFTSIGHCWKLDKEIYDKLFDYQQVGVEWFLKKYDQNVGGILADEMGLGKTIQTICFLRAIQEAGVWNNALRCEGLGRVLLICPASIMQQWVREFHTWFPKCRVVVLHASSSTGITKDVLKLLKNRRDYPNGCVFLTTYSMFVRHSAYINAMVWSVAVLDEGHKIKNTKTKNYQEVSRIATPRRFVLSGSPIQNNLSELWTLIEFIYPGKLGSFNSFSDRIMKPIQDGSYLTAKPQQQENAYQCALILQEAVKPYILRRLKVDMKEKLDLTDKHEQILFCNLTSRQRKTYETYLKSDEVNKIFSGKLDAFVGYTKMAHICNHPGIYEKHEPENSSFGGYRDSGKLVVLMRLLKHWKKAGENKVLIYSQKKTVIRMLEYYFEQKEYKFLTMTGETPVAQRHGLVEKFSEDDSIFCFLLTTKVGGVGLNLTAANRIVIIDPDWNPTTDQQAKERAWRIGQTRDVVIYRLITVGTIEEKTYLRQIHKEFLSSRVLGNARTREVIPKESLRDLFRLTPEGVKGSEAGIYVDGEVIPKEKKRKLEEENGEEEGTGTKRKKIKKSCLADFEDRKTLASLFEGDVLSAIITHEKAVMHEQDRMILRINAQQHALDAAKMLIHAEGRPSGRWEQRLLDELPDSKDRQKSPSSEMPEEPKESFWSTVNKNLKQNDGSKELERRVDTAKDLRYLFLRKKGELSNSEVKKCFKMEKMTGIDSFFFNEILNTLAKYNDSSKTWKLRSKYK